MASMPVLRPKGTPTIFGDLVEKNITFLIDTSGSMYPFMDVIKEHLQEVLVSRAFNEKDTAFNIMEFSSTVIPWADQMVKCTPQTTTVAGEWIMNLKCKTGTNTLDALLAAFADTSCQSVYLVTDGLPDQPSEVILQHVSVSGHRRPVHCIYLTGTDTDTPAFDFLQSLAIETAGSFNLISVSHMGQVEQVKAVVNVDHTKSQQPNIPAAATTVITTETKLTNPPLPVEEVQTSQLTDSIQGSIQATPQTISKTTVINEQQVPVKVCSVRTSLDSSSFSPQQPTYHQEVPEIQASILQTNNTTLGYPNKTWETYRMQPRLLQRQVMPYESRDFSAAPTGCVLLHGIRVLARRDRDGLYCPGTVKEQVTLNRCYLIEFDTDPKGGVSQHRLQETGVYDIIPYNEAMRHPIVPGDKVLAPVDEKVHCYAPGTVLEGIEGRSSGCAADSESLVISLFNGKTVKATTQMAIWIPLPLHDRIKLETQMPLSARQYLINSPNYPSHMPPGYVLAPSADQSHHHQVKTFTTLRSPAGQPLFIPSYPLGVVNADFRMPSVGESAVKSTDMHKLIPGTSMTKEDLNRKVMSQLIQHKMVDSSAELTHHNSSQSQVMQNSLKKSVSFKETNSEFDSGVSSVQTDDEEKQDPVEEVASNLTEDEGEDEEDLETLKMSTQNLQLNDTDDSGIGTETSSRIGTEPSSRIGREPQLLFSMSDYRKPRRPQSSIPENRPPWRNFSKGSAGGGAKPTVNGFRETAMQCPPQARSSQPIYIDAELAFDRAEPTYLESRPTSTLSTYDNDYSSYPSSERLPSQLKHNKTLEYPAIRSSVQYDNSYRYPADNISPHSKAINTKIQQSPMMQAEKVYYYDPQITPVGVVHRDAAFETIDHSPVMVPDGPINRKSVFRTVNKDGIKSDRIQLEWLLRNQHNQPRPPSPTQRPQVPTHKAFATRDMVRESKESAYMEYRRMQVVRREESFKEKESTTNNITEARRDRIRDTVTRQHKQTDTMVDVTTVRVGRKFTADVQRRDIQRQHDDREKLERTRSAKRAVSFKISAAEKAREKVETEKEQQRLSRLSASTQRRIELEAQREKEIQDTIARRRAIKNQNMTARSVSHMEQVGENRQQGAARDNQMRQKEIQRREHFRNIEEKNQKRKDLRLAVRENKLMDLRSQVLP